MATKVESAPGRLYEQDFYAWTRQQAALLRSRRFNALDLAHLIEAIEDLGDMQREAALSNARVVLEHLLKLAHSPAQDPQVLQDELPRVYEIARRNADGALRDHGEQAAAAALPATCPYTLDQIIADWWP
jgi:hypothetical protein